MCKCHTIAATGAGKTDLAYRVVNKFTGWRYNCIAGLATKYGSEWRLGTYIFVPETANNNQAKTALIVTRENYPTVETSRQFVIQIKNAGGINKLNKLDGIAKVVKANSAISSNSIRR